MENHDGKAGVAARRDHAVEVRLAWTLTAMTASAGAVILAGLLLGLWRGSWGGSGGVGTAGAGVGGMGEVGAWDLGATWAGLGRGEARAVVQAGVVWLIMTPVARVAVALVLFARERDRLYVVIAGIVMVGLVLGMVMGGE